MLVRKVYSNGNLGFVGEIDEVTTSSIRLTTSTYFMNEFNEVSEIGVAMRETSTGTILISGELTENMD